jgi:RHS repeat-associated protein
VKTIAPAVDGVSATTLMQYDAAGNAIRVIDALGRVTDTQYDDRNRAVSVQAPSVWDALAGASVRPSTQTTYDALGQVLTVTDPQGNVTTKHYDRAGRNWKVEAPVIQGAGASSSRPTTLTTFDAGNLPLTVTNPLSQTVTNTYDTLGRLITTVDAAVITNTFAYDEAGNRTSVKDGLNQETTFVYDGFNRLTSQTFANGDTTTFTYNAVQKLSQTSPRGITTTYTYDVRDRVTATSAPGLQRNHSYDVAGRLLSVSEPANPAANVVYTYDVLGRVLSETSRGITHSYTYDIAGNRTQASYGTGRVVTTTYDAFNRPATIVEGGRTTSYGYDLGGRAVMLKAGNGQTSRNVYDELGRLKQRTLYRTEAMTAGEELAQFAWTHDLLGNVTSQSETWPGEPTRPGVRTTSMAYDANNRLTHETIDDPSAGVTATTYAYDAANNRSSKVVTGGTEPGLWSYVYNAANQLTIWTKSLNGSPVKTAALTYDAAGNRIAQSVSENGNAQSTLYSWDAQDRLSSVTMPDGSEHAYKYDYRTRRIATTRSGGTLASLATAILFAGGLSLAEWEASGSVPAMANAPVVEYTRGPDMGGGVGGMLYSLRGSAVGPPTAKYSLSNGRGDIVAQADQGANLTWTASYEAYGKRTNETGTNQDKQRANSKDEDPTGLLNEGFRYRDIETGVWLSRDPAGFVDGPNLYAYVQQNPWTSFDPDGLTGWGVHFPNATSSNSMTNNKEYRTAYMNTAAKGMAVGVVGIAVATGVAEVAAPVLGTGFVSAAVSNGIGGYVANGVSNKIEGGDFNDNAGTAIAAGAAGGVLFHGLMRGGSPGESPPVRGRAPSQPAEEFISGEPPNSSSAVPPPGASPTATAKPNAATAAQHSPDFIAAPDGQVFPVPPGATGPRPVVNPGGKQTGVHFSGGTGGENGKVSTIRIMDPTQPKGASPGYPNGYVKYENASKQPVSPVTGKTIPNSQAHYKVDPPKK